MPTAVGRQGQQPNIQGIGWLLCRRKQSWPRLRSPDLCKHTCVELDVAIGFLRAGEDIRERTDALDAAGNTTAAIGKGFAIGSAALVSLALFGAYVTRSKIDLIESSILDPKVRMLLCLACSVFCVVMPLSPVGRTL